jgi:hypothetical protein
MGLTVTTTKAKPVALFGAVEHILQFLWCLDEREYLHPRIRSQLAWIIIIMAHAGLRPGEIIESAMWRQSNEGIHYRDVDLHLARFDGILKFQMNIRLRNRKGRRGQETS